jgi:hypothetical protein
VADAMIVLEGLTCVIGGMLVILAVFLHFFGGRIELKSRTA